MINRGRDGWIEERMDGWHVGRKYGKMKGELDGWMMEKRKEGKMSR